MIHEPVQLAAHAKVMRFISVVTNQLEFDELLGCLHDDHRLYQNLHPHNPLIGVSGMAALVRLYEESFVEWKLDRADIFPLGTTWAGRIACRARHVKPLGMIRATDRSVEMQALGVWKFNGDRIEESTLFISGIPLLRQIDGFELVDPSLELLEAELARLGR